MESNDNQRLSGKVALVTGGAGAIGSQIVRTFVRHGAKVAFVDLDEKAGKALESELGPHFENNVYFSDVDVSQEIDVEIWIRNVYLKWGRIDILVNNAAAFVFGKITDVTSDDWDKVLSVNVKGYALCAKYAVKAMLECKNGGSIIHVASMSSFIGQPEFVPYNTSKGAILQLSRCIALDHGPDSIRSNCVCPGTIDTPATSKHASKLGLTKEELTQQIVETHFIKRLGTTQDVANAVLFLASDESSFITGSNIMVDGGYTAQ